MSRSSSPIDIAEPLVLDTSVLINLHACKYGERILTAIPNDILVSEIAAGELKHETSRRNGEYSFLHTLVAGGIVTLVNLTDAEYGIFHELTSTAPSLDDGEAATIAVATSRNCLPVLDERKGRLRAPAHCGGRPASWSLDIFRHPQVVAILGAADSTDALYLALRDGRMRIHEDHCDHVVNLIGIQRALECNSLPGYRIRRQEWQARVLLERNLRTV